VTADQIGIMIFIMALMFGFGLCAGYGIRRSHD